ncbi:hypothetical protein [Polaribacter sp.]|uniref:hypothetical protein n=1 Tax=Polaribacter sp. TaxID=1920175 RepID=UPI003F6C52D3
MRFEEELENKAITYNLDLSLKNDDFIRDIADILSSVNKDSKNLEYVYFVNQKISIYIRRQLRSFANAKRSRNVDIDSFNVGSINFKIKQNRVSRLNIVRPNTDFLDPKDFNRIVLIKLV